MQNMDMIEANREYYRETAITYDSGQQPFVHQGLFLENLLSRLDGLSPNLHILDFGAGTGSSTQKLLELFPSAQVVGLDVSQEMLSIAVQKCPTASFDVFDGKQIPFDKARFDGVLVSAVLHHIQDYERILVEITRVCKAKAWIVITQEPNPPVNRWANRIRRLLAQNVPDLVRRAEGYQFSKEGGIPPNKIVDTLMFQGFSCELIYNNDGLLDCLLMRHRALYRLLKAICHLRRFPLHVSYNVLAERRSDEQS